eukprot:TRINITY_DN7382_c0_g1_i1.p2 TRINITY_DN7382_c0_g1~~TRINITY_DN7382_c0_g1_i1.p2  ORF type:complete len:305 (+),score=74.87 TRINITY_DN7382_c0_g1_i1:1553-2467(+)
MLYYNISNVLNIINGSEADELNIISDSITSEVGEICDLTTDNLIPKTAPDIDVNGDLDMLNNNIQNLNELVSGNNVIDINNGADSMQFKTFGIGRFSVSASANVSGSPFVTQNISELAFGHDLIINHNNITQNVDIQNNSISKLTVGNSITSSNNDLNMNVNDITDCNSIEVDSIINRTGQDVSCNGILCRTGRIELDSKTIIEHSGTETTIQFDQNDFLRYDQDINQLIFQIQGNPSPEFVVNGNGGPFESNSGFDSVVSEQLDIGPNNATSVAIFTPLKVDNIQGFTTLTDIDVAGIKRFKD